MLEISSGPMRLADGMGLECLKPSISIERRFDEAVLLTEGDPEVGVAAMTSTVA